MHRILTKLFCRFVVPQFKFMKHTNFKLVEGPNFHWFGFKYKHPGTEAFYENQYGKRASFTVRLLDDQSRDDRVAELEKALQEILNYSEEYGNFSNGVTDPMGLIDEGNYQYGIFSDRIFGILHKNAEGFTITPEL